MNLLRRNLKRLSLGLGTKYHNLCTKYYSLCTILLFLFTSVAQAQTPVQITPQLLPPYSLQVSDYYSGTQPKLQVLLLNRDINQPTITVRLKMTVQSQNCNMQTKANVVTQTFTLTNGVPYYLQPNELQTYFDANNLDFGGGYSQQEYVTTGRLPEGLYTFSFEAYEVQSNNLVSNKGFALGWLTLADPPMLNTPAKAEGVIPGNPQNIVFNWTPRHNTSPLAGYYTDYVYTIAEYNDINISPEASFMSSPPLYRDSVQATTYLYGTDKPQLVPGKRYTWRVQAKARNGSQQLAMFKNNGNSEVFWFTYQNNCAAPLGMTATAVGQRVTIEWQANPMHLDYKVEYREKSSTNNPDPQWFSITNSIPRVVLTDIRPATQYEYRVGGSCTEGVYTYSPLLQFTTNSATANAVPNCGDSTLPAAGTGALTTLTAGETFTAGSFTVNVGYTTGNGSFTGMGYIEVPWLLNAKVEVRFTNITIGQDRKLLTGVVETTYDPTESGIDDLDEYIDAFSGGYGVGGVVSGLLQADTTVNITIGPLNGTPPGVQVNLPPNFNATTGPYPVAITLNPVGGSSPIVIQADSLPYTVQDKTGTIYQVGANGQVSVLAKPGGGALLSKITKNKIDNDKGLVTFMEAPSGKYAFDAWRKEYRKSSAFNKEYERLQLINGTGLQQQDAEGSYYVAAKAIAPAETEPIRIKVQIPPSGGGGATLSPDSIQYVTGKGSIYTATKVDSSNVNEPIYELNILGGPGKDAQEIYAIYPGNATKNYNLGKLLVASYEKKNKELVLITVDANNLNKDSVQKRLNLIYNPVNIYWTVKQESIPFTNTVWDKNGNGKLDISDDKSFGILTDEMQSLNKAYRKAKVINNSSAYIYLIKYNDSVQPNIYGGMPRGLTFGYLFLNKQNESDYLDKIYNTAAHEIGHGIFRLEHTFEYGDLQINNLSDNLMDYSFGKKATKLQWDMIADPPIVVRGLENEEETLMVGGNFSDIPSSLKNSDGSLTCLTPSKKVVTIPSTTTKVYFATADPYYFSGTSTKTGGIGAIGSLIAFTVGTKYYDFGSTSGNYHYECDKCTTPSEKYYEDNISNSINPATAIVGFPHYSYLDKKYGVNLLKYQIQSGERLLNNNVTPNPTAVKSFGQSLADFYFIIDKTNSLTEENLNENGQFIWDAFDDNYNPPSINASNFPKLSPFAEQFLEVNKDYAFSGSPLAPGIISLAYWLSLSEAFEGQAACQLTDQNNSIEGLKFNLYTSLYFPKDSHHNNQDWTISQAKYKLFHAAFYKYRDLIKKLLVGQKEETNLNSDLDKLTTVSQIKSKVNSLTKCQRESISFETRLRFIKVLEPANAEEEIIKLISTIEYNNQAGKLLDELFKNQASLFRKLWTRLDFSEFHEYIAKVTEISKADFGVESCNQYFDFTHPDPSFSLTTAMDYSYDGDYLVITKKYGPGDSEPIYFSPNEMVNIRIPKENSYIKYNDNPTEDVVLQMPAYYIAYLIRKKRFDQTLTVVRVAGNLIAIAAAIPTGGASLTVLSGVSAGLATADLAVCYFEDDLRTTEAGKTFLEIWQVVQLADAGVGITNIAGKAYKAVAIKFDDLIDKFAKLDFSKRAKLLHALRSTPQIMKRLSLTGVERLYSTKILARIESEIIKKMMTTIGDASLDFKGWVSGMMKYDNIEKNIFDLMLASNGAYLKFVDKLADVYSSGEKVVVRLVNVRYFDDLTGLIKEGNIKILYNSVTKTFKGLVETSVSSLSKFNQKFINYMSQIDNAITNPTNKNKVWRILRDDQIPSNPIVAKSSTGLTKTGTPYTIEGHVANGSKANTETPYISTWTNKEDALAYALNDGAKKVVEIDLTKFSGKFVDLSNEAVRNSLIKGTTARNFAASSSEFLIVTDEIPVNAIKLIN